MNTFLSVLVIVLCVVQLNRMASPNRGANQGGMGGMGGGMGRGGPNTSAGRMTGGSQRGASPPPTTTFADVAGVDEAKEELMEIVDILKRPEHYTRLGARPPSGVLLVGAPGTGKTLLARAVAGEAGVPFISVSASEFVELYVGMGAARVRDVFARAREQAPSIVFIDEIDAVAKGRSDGKMRGMGNDEREQTLNQLLTELDGFDSGSLVICLAATNRADTLDSALKRPGRFDRTVSVERPDKQGRKEILGVHIGSRNLPMQPGMEIDDIATMTAGFTGADLANLVNEAALLAGRKGLKVVGKEQFESAVLRTVAGIEKKRSLLGPAEKEVVSAHEAGHAVVGTAVGSLIPGQQRPEVLSIVARSGGALGFTYIPPGEEDRKLMFADELRGRLVTLMGGRAAEIVACSRVSTGALDDIQRATDLAYKAVAEYGLSPTVGPMSVPTLSSGGDQESMFGGGGSASNANLQVEFEVKETLTSALWVAKETVEHNLAVLMDISRELSEQEKVQGADLQVWLDKVTVTPSLERFLRGENPLPPEGSNVWDNLPLPKFPAKQLTAGEQGGK
jgi:cell division protease FtsH